MCLDSGCVVSRIFVSSICRQLGEGQSSLEDEVKVKRADVRTRLPADTPTATIEERMAEIAQRRRSAQRRFGY